MTCTVSHALFLILPLCLSSTDQQQQQKQWARNMGRGQSQDCETLPTGKMVHPGSTKRVHYAAQTFARASSLSGHIPGYDNHHAPSVVSSTAGGSAELSAPRPSRHSMLQRQLSTTTGPPPLVGSKPPTASILKNGTSLGKSIAFFCEGESF